MTMTYTKAFVLIGVAVAGWGVFHAVGAYHYNHHLGRFFMVTGCVVAFLAFWAAMLAARRRRLSREQHDTPA
jgi:hypothetical protein